MAMIRFLCNSALDAVKKSFDEMNKAINSFELNDIDKMFEDVNKTLSKKTNELKKRFKNTNSTFEVIIPYDRDNDTLETKIENSYFKAFVKSLDGETEKTTSVYIPEDIDVNSVSHKYDSEKQIMHFVFKKINV